MGLISLLFSAPLTFITIAIALLFALTIHECAHAYIALKRGDSTASDMGRVTLNPFAHLDPIGTLFLLIAGFGWGKPVIVNPARFKNPIKDNIIVALSGPASNALLAIVAGFIFQITRNSASIPLQTLLQYIGLYNLVLMGFNLLPIPPLDGSKILKLFVSPSTEAMLEHYGIFILLFLIFIPIGGKTIVDLIIFGPISALFSLLFHTSSLL